MKRVSDIAFMADAAGSEPAMLNLALSGGALCEVRCAADIRTMAVRLVDGEMATGNFLLATFTDGTSLIVPPVRHQADPVTERWSPRSMARRAA